MRWIGTMACIGMRFILGKVKWENRKEIDNEENLDLGGRRVLKWGLEKEHDVVWTGSCGSGQRSVAGCGYGKEASNSVNIGRFLTSLGSLCF
jgi:hypothetical protein